MNVRNVIWLSPFLSFIAGYLLFSYFFLADSVQTPVLVGKPLPEALQALSEFNLNARLVAQKPDPDLPEGTVLAQMPEGKTLIKSRQNVFLVISQRPPAPPSPNILGLAESGCILNVKEAGLRPKIFHVPSNYPAGICIGQYPSPGIPVEDKVVTAYISRPDAKIVIFPSLVGLTYGQAQEFLKKHGFAYELFSLNRTKLVDVNEHAQIIDQKPRGGSLINREHKEGPIYLYFE